MAGRVPWTLPPALVAADEVPMQAFDRAVRAGEEVAGCHVACRAGCTDCCIVSLDIAALDAARLLGGLEALDPEP